MTLPSSDNWITEYLSIVNSIWTTKWNKLNQIQRPISFIYIYKSSSTRICLLGVSFLMGSLWHHINLGTFYSPIPHVAFAHLQLSLSSPIVFDKIICKTTGVWSLESEISYLQYQLCLVYSDSSWSPISLKVNLCKRASFTEWKRYTLAALHCSLIISLCSSFLVCLHR